MSCIIFYTFQQKQKGLSTLSADLNEDCYSLATKFNVPSTVLTTAGNLRQSARTNLNWQAKITVITPITFIMAALFKLFQ